VRRAAIRAVGALRVHTTASKLHHLASEDESDSVRLAARAALLLLGSDEKSSFAAK